jgi:hypothetical protein
MISLFWPSESFKKFSLILEKSFEYKPNLLITSSIYFLMAVSISYCLFPYSFNVELL